MIKNEFGNYFEDKSDTMIYDNIEEKLKEKLTALILILNLNIILYISL